ncbi:MAG: type II secretion system F family protein [archaeon]|jgi:archaellum biogenesis protein FlaJ (TadC family)
MKMYEKYDGWVKFTKIHYNTNTWIMLSIFSTILVVFGTIIFNVFVLDEINLLPVAFGSATLVLTLGYPYMKKESIIDNIENNFSDALKQMADTLKAGDTYESALREVKDADYGRLSEEIGVALRRLEEGENIETALKGFSDSIDSRLVKRTMIILLDSIKTGSGLAALLEDIAEDVRDTHRLKEDRKANTTMQFLFMIAAGGFIAPLIFGEVTAIMGLFSKIVTATMADVTDTTSGFILLLVQAYLLIEVIGSGIMMSIIREGNFNKSIIYIPVLLVIAYVSYYASSIVIGLMLTGAF